MTRHVAIYARISQDKRGRREGVAEQIRWGQDYAADTWPGLPVVVYDDNNRSGTDDERPGLNRMRQAIRDGHVVQVLSTFHSRLTRSNVWFNLATEMLSAGVEKIHTRHDGIVDVGSLVADILAVINKHYVMVMKLALMDRLDANAKKGQPSGSRPCGFAHAVNAAGDKTYVHVTAQAAGLRDGAGMVLSGWSMARITDALAARGMHGPHRVKVKNSQGKIITDVFAMRDAKTGHVMTDGLGQPVTRASRLTATALRSMLTNPTIAGWRVHRGVIVGRGNWEPILDEATWQACRAVLSAPRTVRQSNGKDYPVSGQRRSSGRKYIMTGGLAVCGVCNHPLVGSKKQLISKKKTQPGEPREMTVKPYLLCHPKTGGKACVGILLEETDADVLGRLWAELDKPEFLSRIAADDHAARRADIGTELAGIEGQRRELAAVWSSGSLTTAEWGAARDGLAVREAGLRAELEAKAPPPALTDIEQARGAWDLMELGERRQFIRLFIERVTIMPATPGFQAYDPRRVVVTWKDA